jgi:hypothetical protein
MELCEAVDMLHMQLPNIGARAADIASLFTLREHACYVLSASTPTSPCFATEPVVWGRWQRVTPAMGESYLEAG